MEYKTKHTTKDKKYTRTEKVCLECKKPFMARVSDVKKGYGLFCSRECVDTSSIVSEKRRAIRLKNPGVAEFKGGEKHWNWKGGKHTNKQGYVYIKAFGHPFAVKGGYVLEHRLVMEKVLGRYLEAGEEVHHINGIKNDNNPENLKLVLWNFHEGSIRCPHCLKTFLIK